MPPQIYHPTDSLGILTYDVVIQLIKFGTISFFLLSGFLIGEKFASYPALQYLKKRVDNTFLPWIFWVLFFCLMIVANDLVSAKQFYHGELPPHYGLVVLGYLQMITFYTVYWFIPNFLICIGLLLIFKRYLYSYWFGAVLLCFTILYMFNIYYEWIEPKHSTAIFGFVFFLWLGVQLNRHLNQIKTWLDATPLWLWVILLIITLLAGVYETSLLKQLKSEDPYNSLRPTNILYSLCFFFTLFKIRKFKRINYLKPRETTYGIYLIHYILVYCLLPVIFPTLRLNIDKLSYGEVWCYLIARFLITYLLTLGIVMGLNKTKAKWLVGR
jgi:hypothetical protein